LQSARLKLQNFVDHFKLEDSSDHHDDAQSVKPVFWFHQRLQVRAKVFASEWFSRVSGAEIFHYQAFSPG